MVHMFCGQVRLSITIFEILNLYYSTHKDTNLTEYM